MSNQASSATMADMVRLRYPVLSKVRYLENLIIIAQQAESFTKISEGIAEDTLNSAHHLLP